MTSSGSLWYSVYRILNYRSVEEVQHRDRAGTAAQSLSLIRRDVSFVVGSSLEVGERMAENPVIRRFGAVSRANSVATPSAVDLQKMYDQPSFTGPRPTQRFMTLDDVVQRTGAMLLVLLAAGTASWVLTPESAAGPLILLGLMGGLGLGLYMSFTMRANAPLCIAYSVCEGVLLGAISRIFE